MPRDRVHKILLPRCGRRALGLLLISAVAAAVLGACAPAARSDTVSVKPTAKADLYDIDASDVDVKFVLEALARRSGANIVVGPDVTGNINAHLKQVPVESVLDYLATTQGFKWEKSGSTYLVASKQQLEKPQPAPQPPPPPEHKTLVWECKNIKPQDTIGVVSKLFPGVMAVEAPNSVTPAISSAKQGTGSLAGGAPAAAGNSNKIIVIGPPADLTNVKSLLADLDVPRKQVSLQVSVTEISSTANKELGIQWTWSDMSFGEDNASGIGFGKFTKDPMTIKAAISALIKDGKANLLAQPNISVVDNETAEILIGDRILFPKLVGYSQIGTPIYDKEEERVGVELRIAPKIAGDEIVMTLYPQVSLVTDYLKTQAGDYPQISTREARTTVSVKNGQTLAIGGLLRENDIRSISKFPILGDLPILGGLFRHSKITKERTEILILVTPRIVEEKAG